MSEQMRKEALIDYLQARLPHCQVRRGMKHDELVVICKQAGRTLAQCGFKYLDDCTPAGAFKHVVEKLEADAARRAVEELREGVVSCDGALRRAKTKEAKKVLLLGMKSEGGDQ